MYYAREPIVLEHAVQGESVKKAAGRAQRKRIGPL